eukprot:4258241-Alexandrium_andersonii.AAC.1
MSVRAARLLGRARKCERRSDIHAEANNPPQSAIRNPPYVTCKIASGIRTWNCAGPGKASKSAPELSRR